MHVSIMDNNIAFLQRIAQVRKLDYGCALIARPCGWGVYADELHAVVVTEMSIMWFTAKNHTPMVPV